MVLITTSQEKENYAHLRLAGGDNSVTGDQLSENTAGRLNAKGKCGNVDKDNILGAFFSREDTALDCGTIGNRLIGVDTFGRFLATKELLEELLNLGDASGATNENDLRDVSVRLTTTER